MAEIKKASFNRLVWGKAYSNTKRLFADKVKDTLFGSLLALPGGFLSLYRYGLPVEVESALNFAAATFGPIGFVVVVVFLWNLWLAPAELAYDAWRSALPQTTPVASKSPLPINWAIWQQRTQYSADEFAAILAKIDPSSVQSTTEASAYLQLILEAMRNKTIPYLPRYGGLAGSHRYELSVNGHNQIEKENAINWANSKGFPVDHIK